MDRTTLQGVLVVGIVFTSTALCVGASQYGFALFIAPIEHTFGWSRTEISASLSFAAVSGLAAPFLGRAMDRYGARPILVLSLLLTGISFVLRPMMTELWHWYALSLLQFIAFAGATVLPTGKLVAAWFARTRGRAMGIAAMGNNVGGLTIPPLIAAILVYGTWRDGFSVLGLLAFTLAIIALWFVKERPAKQLDTASGDGAKAKLEVGVTVRQAVRSRAFYAVLITVMLGSFTYSAMLPHVYAHLVTEGLSIASASFALGTLAVGGITGKIVFGTLADRIGARRSAITNLIGQATFATCLALAPTHFSLLVLTPMFGVFMGGFGVLISLLVQDTFGLRYFGSVMGLIGVGNVVSFGVGPLIAGASFDLTGSYTPGFIGTAGLFALGALVLFATKTPKLTEG